MDVGEGQRVTATNGEWMLVRASELLQQEVNMYLRQSMIRRRDRKRTRDGLTLLTM